MPAGLAETRDGFKGAFADLPSVEIDARHSGLRGERNERGALGGKIAAAQVVTLFGQDDDGAAFGSFVGKGRELRGVRKMAFVDTGGREELRGGAIAKGDGASLIEEEDVDVTGGLDSAARHS